MKKIIIELKNDEDIRKFEKKIWIYKSLFYSHSHFILKNETGKNDYQDIIDALNIKSRLKRITYIYDHACKQIDEHNKKNGITCNFKCGKCIAHYKTNHFNGCCRVCRYQSQNGCKTQNLSCKLFFCGLIQSKYKTLGFDDIKILKCFSKREKIIANITFFSNREMFIAALYAGSFILVTIFNIISILWMIPSLLKHQKIARKLYSSIEK